VFASVRSGTGRGKEQRKGGYGGYGAEGTVRVEWLFFHPFIRVHSHPSTAISAPSMIPSSLLLLVWPLFDPSSFR
jgi:hypothetical protein